MLPRKPPYLSTLLATALVLALLGVYALLMMQGRSLVKDLRERMLVIVEIREGSDDAQRRQLKDWLEAQAFVKPQSLSYLSKEDGARRLQAELGEDFMAFDLENPLFDLYSFNLPEAYVKKEAIEEITTSVSAQDAVLDVYVQEDLLDILARRMGILAWLGLGIGLILLMGVIFLLVHTTRLALLSRARLIRTMELVGASWGFISRPFLMRSLRLGSFAGLLAIGLTAAIAAFAKTYLDGVWHDLPLWQYAVLALSLVLLGAFISFTATFTVVRRTLTMRDDDLAALS